MLGKRVADGTWNQALLGDVFLIWRAQVQFFQNMPTDDVKTRVKQCDIHPTAPLIGIGDRRDCGSVRMLYNTLLNHHHNQTLYQGLIKNRCQIDISPTSTDGV